MWIIRWIGILAGVISLVALAQDGFNLAVGPALLAVLGVYEAAMGRAFGLLEPMIIDQLRLLKERFAWDLKLLPHWKHFFVLTLLYFSAYARQAFGERLYGIAVFETVLGIVIALVSAVACGTIGLEQQHSGVLIALIPIIGIFLFGVSDSIWGATFLRHSGVSWARAFGVMLLDDFVRLAFMIIPVLYFSNAERLAVFGPLPSPGLAVLGTVIPAIAVYHLWAGSMEEVGICGTEWQRFMARGHTKVGLDILAGIGGAALVVILDA